MNDRDDLKDIRTVSAAEAARAFGVGTRTFKSAYLGAGGEVIRMGCRLRIPVEGLRRFYRQSLYRPGLVDNVVFARDGTRPIPDEELPPGLRRPRAS